MKNKQYSNAFPWFQRNEIIKFKPGNIEIKIFLIRVQWMNPNIFP